jgi:hypothetical protein
VPADFLFHPTIDEVSDELMRLKGRPNKTHNDVFKYLHALDKAQKEKRDSEYITRRIKDYQESIKPCTFRPALITRETQLDHVRYYEPGTIYDRQLQWKSRAQEK